MLLALNLAGSSSALNLPLHVCVARIIMIYRMELTIADDTDEGIFVCFDGVMTKLHGLEAHEAGQILAEDGVTLRTHGCLRLLQACRGRCTLSMSS